MHDLGLRCRRKPFFLVAPAKRATRRPQTRRRADALHP